MFDVRRRIRTQGLLWPTLARLSNSYGFTKYITFVQPQFILSLFFLPFLNYFKSQLIERFIKHNYIISVLKNLHPNFLVQLNRSSNDFIKCIDFYKNSLPTYNTFESKLKVWMENGNQCPIKNFQSLQAIDTIGIMIKARIFM
uniref:Uncharacterized protein n=1 Tax=Sipha flava TaxID=143950 RepID=A0A2S2QT15_9HEMI